MYGIFIGIHLLICVGLIISVLLQSSKGEGLAGAFGGSSLTGTVFGGRGAASFLAKATTILAISFFASALLLTFMSASSSVPGGGPAGSSAVEEAAQTGGSLPVTEPAGTSTQTPAQTQPDQNATPIEQFDPNKQGQTQNQGQTQPPPKPGDSGK